MIRPTTRTLLLAAAGIPLATLPLIITPALWAVWFLSVMLLGVLIAFDTLWMLRGRDLDLSVTTPEILYVGREDTVQVGVQSTGREVPPIAWLLELGGVLTGRVEEHTHGAETWTAPLRPTRRGEAEVRAVWARWQGPLGLAERTRRIALDRAIPVIPDIRSVREEALRFFTRRDFLVGKRVQRYLGEGSEFESLKEYQPGYDPRNLDWKATARHRKLLVREFQAERNHPVLIAIDSGHLMREPIDGIPKLDHAINAALLLSFVALKSGDRVGLLGFDERVREFIPPRRGMGNFHRIQERCARIDYSDRETNFTLSIAELTQRVRRRSLVVLFTDFVDSITAELMRENIRRIGTRHLLLFVGLRDSGLVDIRDAKPRNALSVHRSVVADDLLRERAAVFRELHRLGVQCLDVTPRDLSNALIARYLRIRQREMVG